MLGDLNQQTLLHNTRIRFYQDKIYSFIGLPILIAVNPYKNLNIYSDKNIKKFKDYFTLVKNNPTAAEAPSPHLYFLAEAAYRDMINDKKNQAIIISGESGSGKTESTKIILRYLAESSLSTEEKKNDSTKISVEKQVLDSNPLLEAFGNAKTSKNNNSSRFGKFIQVSFTQQGKILSARIYNYLLEKSRIVGVQENERNYHIFYQFLLGASEEEKKTYRIKDLEYFSYLNKGSYDCGDTDDAKDFLETKACMEKLTFTQNEISYIFNILMGILYLGNIEFYDDGGVAKINDESIPDFQDAAYFLGIDQESLQNILTSRKFSVPMTKELINKKYDTTKAYNCRDAMAKALYSKMFDYIVHKVNRAIANKEESGKYDKTKTHKIGLLDIFGFENFENNSFEQLCINYANERLQQFFNNHIFKIEQDEYSKEGIDYSKVQFVDNNDIIQLIDANKISIFGLLDSEGITPNGNDRSFKENVYRVINNPALSEGTENTIAISHFAGLIEYNVDGFVSKNLDQLTSDISEALSISKNKLIKKLFEDKKSDPKSKGKKSLKTPSKLQSDTLSTQFKAQLDELLEMLNQSNPRYVKCIKPNSFKEPHNLDSIDVMDQLLCAGVLEAIKIRKQGYSIRRTKEDFYNLYHILTPELDIKKFSNYSEVIREMLKILMKIKGMEEELKKGKKAIQVGKTIVFMKEEIKAILDSEKSRVKYIFLLQSTFRGMKVRKKVWDYLRKVKFLQRAIRGRENRIFLQHMREETKKIQKAFRNYLILKKIKYGLKILEKKRLERLQKMGINPKAIQPKPISEPKESNPIQTEIQSEIMNPNTQLKNSNLKPNYDISKKGGSINNSSSHIQNSTKKPSKKNQKPKGDKKIGAQINELIPNIQNVVEDELKNEIENLKRKLKEAEQENQSLKAELESGSGEASQNPIEFQKLKQQLDEKDSNYEILTLKMNELQKTNKNLIQMNESLKSQYTKRKEKFDQETESLYKQINALELAKCEYERRLTQDTKEERASKGLLNLNYNHKQLSELKNENKKLQKKFDDMKSKYTTEITSLKREISSRNTNDQLEQLKNENSLYKNQLKEMKTKLDNLDINSKVSESGKNIDQIKKEYENKNFLLKNENERLQSQLDAKTKKEEVLVTQLRDKEEEIENYKKLNNEARDENENLIDEKMGLTRENFNLKSKIEILKAQYKNQSTVDIKKLNKDIQELQMKEASYLSEIDSTKEKLEKSALRLNNKKKMNLLLIQLAKVKNTQVQCLEGLKLTSSAQLKEALTNAKVEESELLKKLKEVTKADEDESESEEEEEGENEEDEEEEGEEDEEDN